MIRRKKLLVLILAGTATGALAFGANRACARAADQAELVSGFSAKETCSCAFAAEQTDTYCIEFGTPAGYPVTVTIDRDEQRAKATFLGISRTARFTEGAGCVLDALAD